MESVCIFPNQALLCSDFITWTAKLESAINECGGKGTYNLNTFLVYFTSISLFPIPSIFHSTVTKFCLSGCGSLEALQSENSQYVTKLSQLVLQETDPEKTRIYANLILSQGYIRVTIEEMIEEG